MRCRIEDDPRVRAPEEIEEHEQDPEAGRAGGGEEDTPIRLVGMPWVWFGCTNCWIV